MKISIMPHPSDSTRFQLVMDPEWRDRSSLDWPKISEDSVRLIAAHLGLDPSQVKKWSRFFKEEFSYEFSKTLLDTGSLAMRFDRGINFSISKNLQ